MDEFFETISDGIAYSETIGKLLFAVCLVAIAVALLVTTGGNVAAALLAFLLGLFGLAWLWLPVGLALVAVSVVLGVLIAMFARRRPRRV